jgi:hypothetical protein
MIRARLWEVHMLAIYGGACPSVPNKSPGIVEVDADRAAFANGIYNVTQKDGRRCSSYRAFIHPVRHRKT